MTQFQPSSAPESAAIRQACGAKVFERGQSLASGHELAGLMRVGDEVFGRCSGSTGEVYDLRVALENGAVSESHCSCPFDGSGLCKHRVGLLLRLWSAPADFETLPPLRALLGEFSTEQLHALIEQMVRRAPVLLPLVTLRYPARPGAKGGAKSGGAKALQPVLRRALSGRTADDGAFALEIALNEATQLEGALDWAGAGAIYLVMLEELVRAAPRFEKIWQKAEEEGYESDGDDAGVGWAKSAFEGLRRCLDTPGLAPELLDRWACRAWELWQQAEDCEVFSLPEGVKDALSAHAGGELWRQIEAWLRAQITAKPSPGRAYNVRALFGSGPAYEEPAVGFVENYERQQALNWLVAGLKARGRDAETTELLLLWGTTEQKFEILMAGRDFEAAEICARNGVGATTRIFPYAEKLEAAGAFEGAQRLAQAALDAEEEGAARLRGSLWGALPTRTDALEWMTQFQTRRRQAQAAKTLGARLFGRRPNPETLRMWRAAVVLNEDWDASYALRERELPLETQRLHLALCDRRAARALQLFDALTQKERKPFSLELANLCEADFPQRAIELFQLAGEQFVAARGESNPRAVYREAARVWLRARDLHTRLGTLEAWNDYLAAQRVAHKALRALQDELKQAGL